MGGGRYGEGAGSWLHLETPSPLPDLPLPDLPLPWSAAIPRDAAGTATGPAGGGEGWREGERMRMGHPGGGATAAAGPEGRALRAAGREQRPWSPGWERADAGAKSQTGGRGLRWEGWAASLVRTSETAHRPTPSRVLLPRDPFSLPERPTVWEGPPADAACVHAASAPVTGVACRRGGGCGAATSRLAALPRRLGSDDRDTAA